VRKARLVPGHPDTLASLNNLAAMYRAAGRPRDAVPLAEEAAAVAEAHGHPETARFKASLGHTYLAAGQPEKALPLFEAYLAAERARLKPDDPRLGDVLARLGTDLLDHGRPAEAARFLRECLAIREKAGPDAWTTSNARVLLGHSLFAQRKLTEAAPLLSKGYAGLKQREAELPPTARARLAGTADRLAELYAALGQPDEARTWRAERAEYPPEQAPPPRPRPRN
jgi:tetratricopeptide (TPR) repeat protein